MYDKGEETLKWMKENGRHGIVLPAVRTTSILGDQPRHPGTDQFLRSGCFDRRFCIQPQSAGTPSDRYGSVDVPQPFVCRSKLCKTRDDLDLIQLNSFGCGLDAVTTDHVNDILYKLRQDLYLSKD